MTLQHDTTIDWIDPRDWLAWLVRKGLWTRLAGVGRDEHSTARALWAESWERYRVVQPHFQLFDMDGKDLSRTAAFLIHGDEGRTLKRQAIMVTALQSALGYGFDRKRMGRGGGGPRPLKVNYLGHSFTHRFIISMMPKTVYESAPESFHNAMENVAISLKSLLFDGYRDPTTHELFRIAIIAVKGDAPYLAKVGRLYRSFNTLVKRGDERTAPKGICHRCLAGTYGYPAEQIDTVSPKWLGTQGVKIPWKKTPAVIKHLAHDVSDPSTFFQGDIWHIVHLGFGRSWVASVIQLVLEVVPAPNLESKWQWLTNDYKRFCKQSHRQCHISSITPYLMSYNDRTGCMGNWSKGALTTNCLLWLDDLIGKLPPDACQRLPKCQRATVWMNELWSCLFRAEVFLTEEQCFYVATRGVRFLQTYSLMARDLFGDNRPWVFPLYGKLHGFHEQMLTILQQARLYKMSLNPIVFCCQIDEDAIGKASRISRRVNIRQVIHRSLQRYLIAAHTAFTKEGLLRWRKGAELMCLWFGQAHVHAVNVAMCMWTHMYDHACTFLGNQTPAYLVHNIGLWLIMLKPGFFEKTCFFLKP